MKKFHLSIKNWKISNKIAFILITILLIFMSGLSVVIGMTSFNNLATIALGELEKMSNILAIHINGLEKNSISVARSFEDNEFIVQKMQQLSKMGPYFSLDSSFIGLPIEDSEIIYMFQAQLDLIQRFQQIQQLNNLSAISIYLISPFQVVPESKPILALRVDKENILVTQFKTKGDVDDRVIYSISVKTFKPPAPDYFDISSVYSLQPKQFFEDNHFQPFLEKIEQESLPLTFNRSNLYGSKLVIKNGSPLIRTCYTMKAEIQNPKTFEDEKTDVAVILIDQALDAKKVSELHKELKIDIAFAHRDRLLVSNLNFYDEERQLQQNNMTTFCGQKYYFSKKPVQFSEFSSSELQVITLSPMSFLSHLTKKLFYQIAMVCICFMLLKGVIIYFIIQRMVNRPLNHLMEGVKFVSKGNLAHKVFVSSHDEVGLLAKAFNEMSKRLLISGNALQRSNKELEKRVQERTAELQTTNQELIKAKDKADAAAGAKSDFLARMSHEIRTPMNAIIGLGTLVLQTELTSKQMDYLSKIQSSAHALLGIINDILDFSKIDAGKMEFESVTFNLDEVMENLSNLISFKAADKGLEMLYNIDNDVPRFLVGDPLRLGQVLINLCNNAVKFTQEGEIVVRIEKIAEKDMTVTIRFDIKDTGIGLTQEQTKNLFQAFSQADGTISRKYGGTGLGLAISKRLVEMMQGEIKVESTPGQGTTFSFTALFGQELEIKQVGLQSLKKLYGTKILVVDDNASSREIFTSYLESFSFETDTAVSGDEAIEKLEKCSPEKPYEIVLMDWNMPGMDGIQSTREIRSNKRISKIPHVILVTAYGREDVMKQAKKAGIDVILFKPVNHSTLLDSVMQIFGHEVVKKIPSHLKITYETECLKKIKGAKILLVEDNEINQQVATELIAKAGFFITVANNGREGVHAVLENDFDLVFMDIQMPEMDGFEATAHIRQSTKKSIENLPIIAMTAHALVGDREKCLQAGMNDHISKPIDPEELFSKLVKWIQPGDREIPTECLTETGSIADECPLPDMPGILIQKGIARVSGNQNLYRNILIKFHTNNLNMDEQIKTALESGNVEQAKHLIHTIKGLSGTIGAQELNTICIELELAVIKEEDDGTLNALLEVFSQTLKKVLNSLKAVLPQATDKIETDKADETIGDDKELLTLLMDLEPHLKTRKPKACAPFLKEIKNKSWSKQYAKDVSRMIRLIEKYNFKEAEQILNVMLEKF
ncbi:MAG: response regulator [Candidatus Magnetomorum sp.]|nr:response regulator [Candidatus Magnetomorum sp.]